MHHEAQHQQIKTFRKTKIVAWLTNRTKHEVEQSQRHRLFSTFFVPDKYPAQNQSVSMTAGDQNQQSFQEGLGGASASPLTPVRPRTGPAASQELGPPQQQDFQRWTQGRVRKTGDGMRVTGTPLDVVPERPWNETRRPPSRSPSPPTAPEDD